MTNPMIAQEVSKLIHENERLVNRCLTLEALASEQADLIQKLKQEVAILKKANDDLSACF
jgi:hypothetical protein